MSFEHKSGWKDWSFVSNILAELTNRFGRWGGGNTTGKKSYYTVRINTSTWAFAHCVFSPPSVIINHMFHHHSYCIFQRAVSDERLSGIPSASQIRYPHVIDHLRLYLLLIWPIAYSFLNILSSLYPLRVGILLPQFHQLLRHDRVPGVSG